MLFSKDYAEEKVRELIQQFRNECIEQSGDIWGDYYEIEVDKYFTHKDEFIRNGCIDIFGVKIFNIIEGPDAVWLDESFLRIINSALKLRPEKSIRILLLIKLIDYFKSSISDKLQWYGKNSHKREEQEIYQKSKEVVDEIKKLDLTLSAEEINLLEQNYKLLDSEAYFYLKPSEIAKL